jgi:hypothetical protein
VPLRQQQVTPPQCLSSAAIEGKTIPVPPESTSHDLGYEILILLSSASPVVSQHTHKAKNTPRECSDADLTTSTSFRDQMVTAE